jgi:hypothetical protein
MPEKRSKMDVSKHLERLNKIEDKLRDLDQHPEDIIIAAIVEMEDSVIELNTEGQLWKGKRADGQPVRPGYTAYTKEIKRAKGQPTNRVTLRDTGDFYESFDIKYGKDRFEIYATDHKAGKLERKYSDQIYGLNDDSLNALRPALLEETQRTTRKIIKG